MFPPKFNTATELKQDIKPGANPIKLELTTN